MISGRKNFGRSIDPRHLAAGGLLAAVCAGLAAGWAGSRILEPATLKRSDVAPSFELEALDGGRLSSEHLRGRPYAILFFSVDCRHCREAVPDMVAVLNRVGREVIVPILVSRSQNASPRPIGFFGCRRYSDGSADGSRNGAAWRRRFT